MKSARATTWVLSRVSTTRPTRLLAAQRRQDVAVVAIPRWRSEDESKPRRGDRSCATGTLCHPCGASLSLARGHTLIEILLALGLSLVILTAVYAALDQHWRYAEAGQRQTERMQVTRALFERASLDLRSVVFRPAASLEHPTGSSNVTRIDVIQADEPYLRSSVGIIGDSESLIVQINTPRVEGTGSQTIRWEMQALASNTRNGKPSRGVSVTEQRAMGLARVAVRDMATLATLEAERTASPNDLLAAEVKTLGFRYFARGSWFDRWDSVARGELPQAVEMTIGFRKRNAADNQADGQEPTGEYRLVIPVPASEA